MDVLVLDRAAIGGGSSWTSARRQRAGMESLPVLRAMSAMMDVPTDEQELPEPVKLRAICEVPDEWEKLGRIRHQRTT